MPKSNQTPLISIYLISVLGISVVTIFSIVMCAMISEFNFPMPRLVHLLLIGCLDVIIRPLRTCVRVLRALRKNYQSRKNQQQLSSEIAFNMPVNFASVSCTQQFSTGEPITRFASPHLENIENTNSTSHIQSKSQSANVGSPNVGASASDLTLEVSTDEQHQWKRVAYNICRVCGLLCLTTQIVMFVQFFVPLFTHTQ